MRRSPFGARSASSGPKLAVLVEQFLRPVAPHPASRCLQVFRVGRQIGHRHLVGAEGPLNLLAIDHLRAGPAFRCTQHDHRPARALRRTVFAALLLDGLESLP